MVESLLVLAQLLRTEPVASLAEGLRPLWSQVVHGPYLGMRRGRNRAIGSLVGLLEELPRKRRRQPQLQPQMPSAAKRMKNRRTKAPLAIIQSQRLLEMGLVMSRRKPLRLQGAIPTTNYQKWTVPGKCMVTYQNRKTLEIILVGPLSVCEINLEKVCRSEFGRAVSLAPKGTMVCGKGKSKI